MQSPCTLLLFLHWQIDGTYEPKECPPWLQAVDAGDQCRLDVEGSIQSLLGSFAQPIIDEVSQQRASGVGSTYNSSTYNVSQDRFLYDHVKVRPLYLAETFLTGSWLLRNGKLLGSTGLSLHDKYQHSKVLRCLNGKAIANAARL